MSDDDRRAVKDWRPHVVPGLRQLPMGGRLLRELSAEAARQCKDSARGVQRGARPTARASWDDDENCDGAGQPRPLVASTLPRPLRQRFAQACRALGIVKSNPAKTNSWEFSHPSWCEFLATLASPSQSQISALTEAERTGRSQGGERSLAREPVPSRKPGAPDRQWCELRIADSHWRLLPGADSPVLVQSHSTGIDPLPGTVTLVADAEGRACAYLKGRQLQIAWLNRYDAVIEPWPAQAITVPANLKLLSLTMCGDWGVEVVASGKQGLRLMRAEYPGTKPDWMRVMKEDRSGPCKAAIFHSRKGCDARAIAVRDKDGTPTSVDVSFGLSSVEFLDAGMTDSGLLYAALGLRDKKRLLVLQWPGATQRQEEIELACDVPEGLVVVRNGAAADCVLVHADGRLLRLAELHGKVAHASS